MNQLIQDCLRLKSLINMKGNPVCIRYCDEIAAGRFHCEDQVVCQSLQDARYGKEIAVFKENSKCTGGSYFTGLLEYNSGLLDFWVRTEKTHSNCCAALNYLRNVPPPPTGVGRYVTLSPIQRCSELPDLVAFFCNPAQAARLLGLHVFQRGRPSMVLSYAAACAAAIGIPMSTGDPHLSLIDNSARVIAKFQDDEVIVTIPATEIGCMASNVERCIWGTAQSPYLAIESRLKGTWKLATEEAPESASNEQQGRVAE